MLACLANFSTEGRGKKRSKEGKCAVCIFDDNEFYQARKCLEARTETNQMQLNQSETIRKYLRYDLKKRPSAWTLISERKHNFMFVLLNEGWKSGWASKSQWVKNKQITAWKVLCTVFTPSLVLYQKTHSFATLTRSFSDTSTTRV